MLAFTAMAWRDRVVLPYLGIVSANKLDDLRIAIETAGKTAWEAVYPAGTMTFGNTPNDPTTLAIWCRLSIRYGLGQMLAMGPQPTPGANIMACVVLVQIFVPRGGGNGPLVRATQVLYDAFNRLEVAGAAFAAPNPGDPVPDSEDPAWMMSMPSFPCYWIDSGTDAVQNLMPVRRDALTLELIPMYDQLSGRATTGGAFSTTGTPVFLGDQYNLGSGDGLVFSGAVAPYNYSLAGFTMLVAGKIPDGSVPADFIDIISADLNTSIPLYSQVAGAPIPYVVVTYDAAFSRDEVALCNPDTTAGSHVIAYRYTRLNPAGSRGKCFVDGVSQDVTPNIIDGTPSVDGVIYVEPTAVFILGSAETPDTFPAIGAAYFWSQPLSDAEILAASQWVQANHPVV